MARAAYLAPGVYVEEVPSAQQPIAGVGTNTVGFLGVVPDEIQYPVPNEDYDPVLARGAAGGAGEAQEIEGEKRKLEDEIRQQEGMLKESQDAQTQLKQQLDAPGLEEAAKNRLNRDKARRDRDVERITTEINNRKNSLAALTEQDGGVDGRNL